MKSLALNTGDSTYTEAFNNP